MVEIDRGTMPIVRGNVLQTSFDRKMRAYLSAHAARQHEQHFGWKTFRVLTVTTDATRIQSMRQALADIHVRHSPGPSLFFFAIRNQLHVGDPLLHIWTSGEGRSVSLLESRACGAPALRHAEIHPVALSLAAGYRAFSRLGLIVAAGAFPNVSKYRFAPAAMTSCILPMSHAGRRNRSRKIPTIGSLGPANELHGTVTYWPSAPKSTFNFPASGKDAAGRFENSSPAGS